MLCRTDLGWVDGVRHRLSAGIAGPNIETWGCQGRRPPKTRSRHAYTNEHKCLPKIPDRARQSDPGAGERVCVGAGSGDSINPSNLLPSYIRPPCYVCLWQNSAVGLRYDGEYGGEWSHQRFAWLQQIHASQSATASRKSFRPCPAPRCRGILAYSGRFDTLFGQQHVWSAACQLCNISCLHGPCCLFRGSGMQRVGGKQVATPPPPSSLSHMYMLKTGFANTQ